MKYQKLLIGTVIILAILNITLIGFIGFKHFNYKKNHSGKVAKKIEFRKLGFSDEQVKIFKDLFQAHKQKMSDHFSLERDIKKKLHRAIILCDEKSYDPLYTAFKENQMKIEKAFFNLLTELSNRCNEEQKENLIYYLNQKKYRKYDHNRKNGRN